MICGGRGRILDAGQLDRDLIVALRADLGLGDAEPVDAVRMIVDRPVEVLVGERRGPFGGTAWSVTSSPPCRSSPSVGRLVERRAGMASRPTPTSAATTSATTMTAERRVMLRRSG